MKRLTVLALLLTCASLALGCGSDDNRSSTTPAASTTTAQSAQDASPAAEQQDAGPLAEVRERLVAAGYRPRTDDASDAAASLEVAGVSIAAYDDHTEAQRVYREIRGVYAEQPGRGVVDLFGSNVYYSGAERQLTDAERKRFAEVVIAAEAIVP